MPTPDPCASPTPLARGASIVPPTSPAASIAAVASAGPVGSPQRGSRRQLDPAASPSPTPLPTFDPCAPLESPEPTGEADSGDKVVKAKPVTLSLRKVADGFENPNGLTNAGDDRLFVHEQEGYIVVLKPTKDGTFRNAGTFLDFRERVECCGEKGFLGLAFPPDYAETGLFYVTYAGPGHNWYLDERRVSKNDPDRADPDYRRNLISEYKPRDFHWGGNMFFGPDGYLWIGMGDGGFDGGPNDPGDPDNRAQDLSTIFGKFLRIDPTDPDGRGKKTARYTIPADNPYVDKKGARPEIWMRGVRNPWRWSFDRVTGDLWVTDVGMHTWEEVNRLKGPNPGKGDNLGWRLMEGPDCYNPATSCQPRKGRLHHAHRRLQARGRQRRLPVRHHGRLRLPRRAVPRDALLVLLRGLLLGHDLKLDSAGPNRQRLDVALDTGLAISAMGTDNKGEIYVLDYTLDKATAIYRLEGKAKR